MKILPIALCLGIGVFQPASGQTRISIGRAPATSPLLRPVAPAEGTAPAGGSTPAEIAGPTLGFVFDRQVAGVRRIPGIAGAASVGEALTVPTPLAGAYTAPQQDYVIGISASDGTVTLISLSHGAASGTSPLGMVPPAPDRIAFSPSGDALALFYAGEQKLIALTGIPQAPQIASSWDLSLFGGTLTALAIKDGGDALLGGITQGSGGVLVWFPAGGAASVLLPMSRPAAAQFLWGSRDAVIADQAAAAVYLLKDMGALQELAMTQDYGVAAPDLLAIDRSGRTVLTGHSGGSTGLAINLLQVTVQPFQCDCVVAKFEPLNGDRIYRVTDLRAGQFVAMDASGSTARFQAIGSQSSPAGDSCPVRGGQTHGGGFYAPAMAGQSSCRAPALEEESQ
jgi:hypothetical protein